MCQWLKWRCLRQLFAYWLKVDQVLNNRLWLLLFLSQKDDKWFSSLINKYIYIYIYKISRSCLKRKLQNLRNNKKMDDYWHHMTAFKEEADEGMPKDSSISLHTTTLYFRFMRVALMTNCIWISATAIKWKIQWQCTWSIYLWNGVAARRWPQKLQYTRAS